LCESLKINRSLFFLPLICRQCSTRPKVTAKIPNNSVDDEPIHHKTINSMATLVATLLKLASYDKQDLENPHGNINKETIAKAEGLGLSLGKDFIAKWLKKADEVL